MVQQKKKTVGLIIGKFMPPHLGHMYLVDFAGNFVDELIVMVCTLKSEPIEGLLRYNWMKQLFPHHTIIHVTDENPQYPIEHPDFWNIWKETIQTRLTKKLDYVFASEEY
jgi:HTH-type transcriptional regulator, transcriptional repressor of NAD biosynthesis genes